MPLAPRFIDIANEPARDVRFDQRVRVLFAPDGMNNLGNYLAPQRRFNLYSFTHWAHIDLLVWFGGTAGQPVSIPARPWIESAHRNGVKVLGTLFFAPRPWGGSPELVEQFLRSDPAGRFPAADQLIAIARYYGFDGWLINEETDLRENVAGGAERGQKMADFMAYLTRAAAAPMEIHWYDAMLPDGSVAWQNALTGRNLPLLQRGTIRVSDAMFLNYNWTRAGLRRSAALAEVNGRSRYELFAGADLWPERNAEPAFRNSHWLEDLREGPHGPALASIALFAPNFNFNLRKGPFGEFEANPQDARRFYQAEVRLFSGDNMNMEGARPLEAHRWPGLASLVPARSTILSLPFETHFNTGHGLHDAHDGRIMSGAWHDMARQDILPTWQFAFSPGSPVRPRYDFGRPYDGGSSLLIETDGSSRADVPLFLTRLAVGPATRLETVARTRSGRYRIRLELKGGGKADFPIRPGARWRHQRWCLGKRLHGQIDRISITSERTAKADRSGLLLGGIALRNEAACLLRNDS